MAGFNRDTVYADNVDFTGSTQPTPQVTANGQLLIGSAAAPNIRVATLTAGAGVSITNGAGSITIGLSGGGLAIDSLIPDSGTSPVFPTSSGQVTMAGSGSITTVGGANTLTTQLTGLTLNAIQVGAGTTTLTQLGPTNRSVLTTGATGVPALTALTDGQLIIGSTAGAPAAASLTAGTNITITPGSNSISIAAAGNISGPGSSTDRAIATWNGTGGTALFDNSTVKIDSSGRFTNTTQPAFLAYLGTTDSNATGDGTNFVIGTGNALTEVFDQSSNFVPTTGVFTAPVTGRYFLQTAIYASGGTSITSANFFINTSNRNYRQDGNGNNVDTFAIKNQSTLADMDAADTATFSVSLTDTGGKVDDIFGAATPFTWCSGYLVC